MARQVINKHVSNASDIHYLNFEYLGEIVICNEAGNEGIYVINTNHEPVKIGSWSGDIDVDTDRIIQDLKGWVTANFASASDITNLQEQIDNISIEIDEEKVKEIVNGEIEKLVDSASTDFNTLGKIERWIQEHPSDVDPQLVADVESLKAISADTRISELESISAGTRLDTIEDKIDGIVKSNDHFVMTYQEYLILITSGSVVVNDQYISYSDDHFYCIYESDSPEPTPEPESGGTIISGDTVIFGDGYPYDDGSSTGEAPSLYIGTIEDEGDGVIVVDWLAGSDSDTPDHDIDDDTIIINDTYDEDSASINLGTVEIDEQNGIITL